jgi:hypothetical protein
VYLDNHLGNLFFKSTKATNRLHINAHKKLKLLGVVEWSVKNHKKHMITPISPVTKNNIKSNHLDLLFVFLSLWVTTIVSNNNREKIKKGLYHFG